MINDNQENRFFSKATAVVDKTVSPGSYLWIVLSPTFIGCIFGGLVFLAMNRTPLGLCLWAALGILGLALGIYWAERIRKGTGTFWFLSRIMASPDIDKAVSAKKPNKA